MIVNGYFEDVLFAMYGIRLFSRVLTVNERNEMGLYEVPMFMALLGFLVWVLCFPTFMCVLKDVVV